MASVAGSSRALKQVIQEVLVGLAVRCSWTTLLQNMILLIAPGWSPLGRMFRTPILLEGNFLFKVRVTVSRSEATSTNVLRSCGFRGYRSLVPASIVIVCGCTLGL